MLPPQSLTGKLLPLQSPSSAISCEAILLAFGKERLAILFQMPSISTAEELPQNEHTMPNPGAHSSDSNSPHLFGLRSVHW